MTRLTEYFAPKKNIIYEIHQFREIEQWQGETIDQFYRVDTLLKYGRCLSRRQVSLKKTFFNALNKNTDRPSNKMKIEQICF